DLAEEREALAEEARDDTEAMRRMAPAWLPAATPPQPAANPWRHRLPVVALAVVCLLLGWVAVRNSEREPERWEWAEAEQAAPEEPPTAEAVAAVEMKPPAQRPASMPVPTRPKPQQSPTVALIERPARALASLVGMAEQAQAPVAVQEVPPAPPVEVAPPPPSPPRLAMAARPALPKAAVATTVERQKPVRVALVAEAEPAPPPVKASSRPTPAPAPTTAAGGTAKPQQVAAAPAPVRAGNAPDPARIEQARRVGTQLLQYLGKPKRAPPPIWNSPVIMSSADGLRHDLHSLGRARIGAPQWRIGNDAASFASDYRVDGIDGPEVRGVLTASMVWRENRWLVVGLGVEQAR